MKQSLTDFIQEMVEGSPSNLSENDKKKQKEVISAIIFEGKSLKESIGLSAGVIEYFYSQGYRLYLIRKYEDALRYFHLLFLFEPANPRYSLALGATYQMMKDYEHAVQWYMTLSIIDTSSPMPFYYMSDCALKRGDPYSAIFFLRKTIDLCKDNPKFEQLKTQATRMIPPLEKNLKARQELDLENKTL
jgi:type III secretion system low calcium response chaperone LcrH/SycD